jgi:hypothetical protein
MSDRVMWMERGPLPVRIGWCPSEAAWKREMKLMGMPNEPFIGESSGRCDSFERPGDSVVLVHLNREVARRHTEIEIVGLLAHESTHAFQAVCRTMGEDRPSPEFEAYTIQAITQFMFMAMIDTWGPPRRRKRAPVR